MYRPNGFGLFDMLGNVSEFVEDCQHNSYEGAPADGSPWIAACAKDMKIRRGGSWTEAVTAQWRGHTGPDNGSSFDGFRVALAGAPATVPASALQFEAELEKARSAERKLRAAAVR